MTPGRSALWVLALAVAFAAWAQDPFPPPPKTQCDLGQSGRTCITSTTCAQIGGAGCVCVGAKIVRDENGLVEEVIEGVCEFLGVGTAARAAQGEERS